MKFQVSVTLTTDDKLKLPLTTVYLSPTRLFMPFSVRGQSHTTFCISRVNANCFLNTVIIVREARKRVRKRIDIGHSL